MNLDVNSFSKWKEDLVKDIRYHDYRDDLDWNGGEFPEILPKPVDRTENINGRIVFNTQSECNLNNIKNYFLKIRDTCKCILEIGVDCNPTWEKTSTRIFLDNKLDETIYIGIDINDKSHLDDESKNIFTLKTDSSDIQTVINFIRSRGIDKIDFIFIDGWHSINQVMREWEYTNYLSDFGIVGFHDTSIHPGPHAFLKALNRSKWNVIDDACSDNDNDWGVGFAWKKTKGIKIISHRGNLTGTNPIRENSIDYIEEAISEGFDVEVDLRVEDDQCYLGHDDPQYFVTMEWLRKYKDVLWIHCKNREALEKMSTSVVEFNYFWHENDCYTITSKGVGWCLVGKKPYFNSVVVLPETVNQIEYIKNSFGICTDTPLFYKNKFLNV